MAAEAETGGERTEEPSQKRLQDARERGQLPRSRELTNFATMIGGSATLLAIGGVLSARMSQMMRCPTRSVITGEYGVDRKTIKRIRSRKLWKHLQ